MKSTRTWIILAVAISCGALAMRHLLPERVSVASAQEKADERDRTAFSHALPQMDGNHLKVSLVEVVYPPGAFSKPHSHPCPVIGYVAEGELLTQVKGEPEAVYKAGETFYEPANGVHLVSGNLGQNGPTKLLAFFLCDHDTPLSSDVPETNSPGDDKP